MTRFLVSDTSSGPQSFAMHSLYANRQIGNRHTSVGFDARFIFKSFETVLKGVFFRSAIVSDKFISRRVDLFFIAYQFPRPSVGRGYVVFVVPTAKIKTAIVAVVTKLNSSNATVSDSSLFLVCHWSPLLKWNRPRVYSAFEIVCQVPVTSGSAGNGEEHEPWVPFVLTFS
jgi:hypothetical protein